MSNTDFILILFCGMTAAFMITSLFLLNRFVSDFEAYVADALTRVKYHNQAVADGIVASPQSEGLTPGLLRFSPEQIAEADSRREPLIRQAKRMPFEEGVHGE